ncbi:HNH endonuclease signature motif containing protein [Arsenicicoccus piscis]|uniref:HNH nuclease domain-containing protein n=1 Tax=Arsenicicoccus piscis TaxID=673954 RepID=A0ABQ6HR13_9MICO|nr:HNH endonuclease signature motif containing protein [Arsenicicoccus piscis]GMA20093.1 hypothetical protein GCM10025862_21140 [Arsenicicoccus piscis]
MGRLEVTDAATTVAAVIDAVCVLREGLDFLGDDELAALTCDLAVAATTAGGALIACAQQAVTRGLPAASGSGGLTSWLVETTNPDPTPQVDHVDSTTGARTGAACVGDRDWGAWPALPDTNHPDPNAADTNNPEAGHRNTRTGTGDDGDADGNGGTDGSPGDGSGGSEGPEGPDAWWGRLGDRPVGLTIPDAAAVAKLVLRCPAIPLKPLVRDAIVGAITVKDALTCRDVFYRVDGALPVDEHDAVVTGLRHLARGKLSKPVLKAFEQAMLLRAGSPGPDLEDRQHTTRRSLTKAHQRADGMWESTLLLDPESHATLEAAIDALSAPAPAAGDSGQRDERTPAQRRADALVTLARLAADADTRGPMGASCRVVVTIDWDTLKTALGGHGQAHDGTILTPSQARRMACDAELLPTVLGGQSVPLDVGRRRLATAVQRAALAMRDKGCSFPRCTAPPGWTRAHHVTHWANGGPTSLDNLALLCDHHHRLVHQRGITATITPDGVTWHTTRTLTGWQPTTPPPPRQPHDPAPRRPDPASARRAW